MQLARTTRNVCATFFTAVLLLALPSAEAASQKFKPGLWEHSATTVMEGAPEGMPTMPTTIKQKCVTSENADYVPLQNTDKNCKITHGKKGADTITWTVSCNNKGNISTGHGEATMNGDTSTGFFNMNLDGGPMGKVVMKTSFKSRRIGDCKK